MKNFIGARVYFRSGLIKEVYIEPTDDSDVDSAWDYLMENFNKMDTLFVGQNSMTRGWWLRTADVIFMERIA